jgi:hypothetical protein
MRAEAKAMIAAAPDHEIVLRTTQTQQLIWGGVFCVVIAGLAVFYYFAKERPLTIADYLIIGIGFLFLYGAWVCFWGALKGYPRLSILGSRLTYHWTPSRTTVHDLNALGPAELMITRARRVRRPFYSLGFRDRRDYEALAATGMMEPILVDGAKASVPLEWIIGNRPDLADEVVAVINARRALVVSPLALSNAEIEARNAAFVRKRRWYWLWPVGTVAVGFAVLLLLSLLEQVPVG